MGAAGLRFSPQPLTTDSHGDRPWGILAADSSAGSQPPNLLLDGQSILGADVQLQERCSAVVTMAMRSLVWYVRLRMAIERTAR